MRWIGVIAALMAVSCTGPDDGVDPDPDVDERAASIPTGNREPVSDDAPVQSGQVWTGTLGGLPITACFDDPETMEGIYYYDAHLRPLRLVQIDEAAPNVLTEIEGFSDLSGATWTIDDMGEERMSATWRNDDRALPIALNASQVEVGGELGGSCQSAQFVEPLLVGGSVRESAATLVGIEYTKRNYTGPAHLGDDEYLVETIALDPIQAGDPAINAALAKTLPDGTVDHVMGECIAWHMPAGGTGYLTETLIPTLITQRWLSVDRVGSTFCGGAHPSHFFTAAIYDRFDGTEADPSTWFKPDALVFYEFEDETDPASKRPVAGLSPSLVTKVELNWPEEDGGECHHVPESGMGWTLGLAKDGVVFIPQLPHVIFACTAAVTIPWNELDPFLSETGHDVRASLQ
ncbi:hypothetical protein [Erythrobacter sp. Alg231-14]|uniref:hypothetical protein n=1 Tax=Erythrobacter sp. Alg231-14 TaxID=1922225 RepID=UPI000D54B880